MNDIEQAAYSLNDFIEYGDSEYLTAFLENVDGCDDEFRSFMHHMLKCMIEKVSDTDYINRLAIASKVMKVE
jgi:hypothetical protein